MMWRMQILRPNKHAQGWRKGKAVAQSGDEPLMATLQRAMHWDVLETPHQTPADIANQPGKVKKVLSVWHCADTQNNALLRKYTYQRKIEYVVIPDAQAEQALRQKLVDIAVLHPPFYFAAEKSMAE